MRELHWHPTDDEWQYYLSGHGRMGVFASQGVAGTFDMRSGDVGYVPFAYGHYIENLGTEPLVFLEDVPQAPVRVRLADPVDGQHPGPGQRGHPQPAPRTDRSPTKRPTPSNPLTAPRPTPCSRRS